jgi:hypothetical protein
MKKFRADGFRILLSRYFDAAEIFPWLVKYRLFKLLMMENGEVHAYDKFVVPVARLIESLLSPIGKNLLFVGEKLN